jgi:peptidoglycan-associated lipoprotein
MSRLFLVLAAAALVSACGSSVKLDAPKVEDRSTPTSSAPSAPVNRAPAQPVASVKAETPASSVVAAPDTRVIYFDFDSYTVRPEFQSVLEAHARFMKADNTKKVNLEGHADERGGREYNLALGQRRSEAVLRALTLLGASDAQLDAVSFGEEKPAVNGSTEDAYSKNRRVEITYK